MRAVFRYRFCKRGTIISAAVILTIIFGVHRAAPAQVGGGGYIQAIDEAKEGSGAVKKSAPTKTQPKSYNPKTNTTQKQTTTKPTTGKTVAQNVRNDSSKVSSQNKNYDRFIVGDKYTFLNNEIAKPVQPIYRQSAKVAGASGLVQVEVLVGENGNVLEARARTGNKLLWEEAEKAALATKFNKPYLSNKPARAMGFIVYRFGKADVEDDDDNF
ncbi:MAG: energy transducer TonB [Pyrinomonadaceae bacterium]